MHAIPIRYKRRQFGVVIVDDAGEVELAVIAGRLGRPVPLDRWRAHLTEADGVDYEGLPEERFARYSWFFEAGEQLMAEAGGRWRNAPRRVDDPTTDQDALEAGEPLPLREAGGYLVPA